MSAAGEGGGAGLRGQRQRIGRLRAAAFTTCALRRPHAWLHLWHPVLQQQPLRPPAVPRPGLLPAHPLARPPAPVHRYNSLRGEQAHEPTPEEMEAYRLKKGRADDPLEFINQAKGGEGGYDYV